MKSRSQESCAPADPARPHARRRRTTAEISLPDENRRWMNDVYARWQEKSVQKVEKKK